MVREAEGWGEPRHVEHQRWMFYPPGDARPFTAQPCNDGNDRMNVFALFRRNGLEVDPNRLNGRKAGKKRHIPEAEISGAPPPANAPRQRKPRKPPAPAAQELGWGWTFESHALERMEERGWTREEILTALLAPDVVRPGSRPGTKAVHYGELCVVYHERDRRVITVWGDGEDGVALGELPVSAPPAPELVVESPEPPREMKTDRSAVAALTERLKRGRPVTIDKKIIPSGMTFIVGTPPAQKSTKDEETEFMREHVIPALKKIRGDENEWAVLKDYASEGTASTMVKPWRERFPELEFRATKQSKPPKGSKLWARYKSDDE